MSEQRAEVREKLLQAGQMAKWRLYRMLVQKMSEGSITAGELRQYRQLEEELGREIQPPADPEPESEREIFADIEAVAAHYDKTIRTIYRWQKQGMPVLPDGRYDREAVDAWRRVKRGLAPGAVVIGADGASDQAGRERPADSGKDWWDKENKKYQARMRELDYLKRMGELIERRRVEDEFVARVHAVKQALLALERSLPPELVACRSEREMSAVIQKMVRDILEGFSRPLPPELVVPANEDDRYAGSPLTLDG